MITEEIQPLSIEGTESRHFFVPEWHPGGITIELEVRQITVWRGERYQEQETKTVWL